MIDPSKSFPSMKAEKVNPNTAFATVSTQAKAKAAAPAPKQVDPHTAAAQALKPGQDADGKLTSKVTPDGQPKDLASAMYPSMVPAYKVGVPKGYEHLQLTPDPKAQAEFLALCTGFGLSQSQAQALADLHVKLVFGPAGG